MHLRTTLLKNGILDQHIDLYKTFDTKLTEENIVAISRNEYRLP